MYSVKQWFWMMEWCKEHNLEPAFRESFPTLFENEKEESEL